MPALFIPTLLAAALQAMPVQPGLPQVVQGTASAGLESRGGAVAEAIGLMENGQFDKAVALLEPLASATEPEAAYILGFLYDRGLAGERDEVAARQNYVTAAMAGQPDAQYALGRLAYEGAGVQRDYGRAYEWFNLAASQGHLGAIYMLGVMHAEGQSVPEDLARAASLFEEAAERGSVEAQHQIATFYLDGRGRARSLEQAARWFEAAAEQGDAESQYNLALLHESGRLAAGADLEEAIRWLRAAASQGLAEAKLSMGLLYLNGRGVEASDEEAARWFADAAEAGDAEGMYLHAAALAEGLAAPPDLDGALMWIERSLRASAGEPMEAIEQRRELRDRLRAAMAERRVARPAAGAETDESSGMPAGAEPPADEAAMTLVETPAPPSQKPPAGPATGGPQILDTAPLPESLAEAEPEEEEAAEAAAIEEEAEAPEEEERRARRRLRL